MKSKTSHIRNDATRIRIVPQVMVRFYLCVLFLIHYVSVAPGQGMNSDSVIPLTRITETVINLRSKTAITDNTCVVIESNGDFHLELRRQELPNPVTHLIIYEGVLNKHQRNDLLLLLNDTNVTNLPNAEIPHIPPSNYALTAVRATVQRENGVQRVAYADWSGPSEPREGATPAQIENLKRLQVALQPLMSWFHHLESSNLKEVKTPSTLCGE